MNTPHHSAALACLRHPTHLGLVTLATRAGALCGLWFEGQRHHPTLPPDSEATPGTPEHALLQSMAQQLDAYFAGHGLGPLPPLDFSAGTAFQQQVWRGLLQVPSGRTCSYGELAAQLGRPTAVRAVAAAVGRNPLSIVVPCHRVLGAQGQLTGYAGGLERKRQLLRLEGVL